MTDDDQIVNKAAYDLAIKCRLKVGGEAVKYARTVVESLRESGLLNDQRYETVGVVIRYDVPNREIVLDDLGALPMPKLGSSVFRKVDVPGETP